MKFYCNMRGDIRITLAIAPGTFVVVKIIKDGPATLKLWYGCSEERTASHWAMYQFSPTGSELQRLTDQFFTTVEAFRPVMRILLMDIQSPA